MANSVTVSALVAAPVGKVWEYYNTPAHIMKWNNASPDWHSPRAENDLKPGGRFNFRMEARDGSAGFDFTGTYNEVVENEMLSYTMDDNRKAKVEMKEADGSTKVDVTFELESENSEELQREGWQSILDNFKSYVESN